MDMWKSSRKSRPKKRLSGTQESRCRRIVVAFVVVGVLWLLFFPGTGLLSLWKKRSELHVLEEDLAIIQQENVKLQKDIERLEHDSAYLEHHARKELNLLRRNETVFDFSTQKPVKTDQQ
jgi:cell division protein FtsB